MIRALARKELRAQAAFFAFVIFIGLINWLDIIFDTYPDQIGNKRALEDFVAYGDSAGTMLHFLLAFSLGIGLILRDFDERTMEFLDALPASRTQIFAVKLSFAILILAVLPVMDLVRAITVILLSRTSIEPELPWDVIWTGMAMQTLQLIVFLSLGVFFSFLRRFAWIAFGIVVWIFIAIKAVFPAIDILNPFHFTRPVYRGRIWVLSPESALIPVLMITVSLGAALFLFHNAGDRILPRLSRGREQARRMVGIGLTLLATIIGVSLLMRTFSDEAEKQEGTVEFRPGRLVDAKTKYYHVTYPSTLSERAQLLLAGADETHDQVAELLGATSTTTMITVDATGAAKRTAGSARWTKIRLGLDITEDVPSLLAILGHETAHVHAARLSNGVMDRKLESTRFFHEGLATFAEHRLFRTDQERDYLRLISATMRARGQVLIQEIVDSSAFAERYDPDSLYPLGESFVAALVSQKGELALHRLMTAMGRESAPQNLDGLELWRDTFQSAGYDFEETVDHFFRQLDRAVVEQRRAIDALPRLTATANVEKERVTLTIVEKIPPGWRAVCRFRPNRDSSEQDYIQISEDKMISCWGSRRSLRGRSAWYQLGLLKEGYEMAIFEPWTELELNI